MKSKAKAHWQRMEYERMMAEQRAKPAGEPTTLKMGEEDAVILFRNAASDDDPHVVLCRMPEPKDGTISIGEPFLLAWGLYWLLQNEEWKDKLIAKTKVKMSKLLNDHGHKTEGVSDE
jgi:hypothetical protein